MEFDPFLYAAFGAGFLAGRLIHQRSIWIGRATIYTVALLVGLFGASLGAVPFLRLLETIPIALGVLAVVAAVTVAAAAVLVRSFGKHTGSWPSSSPLPDRLPTTPLLFGALVGGYAIGRLVAVPTGAAVPWVLYALLALVAFDLNLRRSSLRTLWIPLVAAPVGATIGALAFAEMAGAPLPVAFAATFGMGWYSLAGPLIAARAGAFIGLVAFLINFLREDLTMLVAPVAGHHLRGEGLSALGGATSMDTNLYLISRYGGGDAGSLALASGLVFTVLAGVLLPALLSLP